MSKYDLFVGQGLHTSNTEFFSPKVHIVLMTMGMLILVSFHLIQTVVKVKSQHGAVHKTCANYNQ